MGIKKLLTRDTNLVQLTKKVVFVWTVLLDTISIFM